MGARKAEQEPADPGPGAGAGSVRIILVGPTGLDSMLRLEGGVELIRVKSALEAIGELSEPLDEESPRRAVVIVAPEADPAREAGPGREGEFIAALRHVDPAVRVLRLENGVASGAGPYDGVIGAAPTPEALREALHGGAVGAPAPGAAPPAERAVAGPPPAPEDGALDDSSPADASAARGLDTGDEAMVRLMLQGRDITDAGVETIRGRIGGRDVAFVSSGRTGRERAADAEDGAFEASVSWRGRLLGRLRSREVSPEELAPHAAWLAGWLALRDQHIQLRDAAFTDPLTGAYNRRFFDHFLSAAIKQARKERRALTVLMFDLDNFKHFNDQYGHGAGDDILINAVRLLRSVIRPTDKVCRIGGDEFAVIFYEPAGPRTAASKPPSSVYEIAQRFQKEIAAHKFPKLGREAPGPLTVSGGLATYPWDGGTAEELLARADELALLSKKQGKNAILLGPGAERERGGN